MTELDKFKRRVIRSVARVLQAGPDKQVDDRMWADLQAEVGCDCKLLWERMRTLTLKKMKRLLPADDRMCAITEVAQMQLTDWLLFDLVLVHEDIDVITDDPNSKAMKDLVSLVQMFEIEGRSGDSLTTAWTAATFYYNSFGRQCSPMLLQRRWYQLKKVTRSKFYTFWFQYRGISRLLELAKKNMPNAINTLIAQRYPYIVTKPFKDWHDMIQERLVILPEEFEAKMRSKNAPPKADKNEPDIVLVEPTIETIDLGLDSDSENDPESSKDSKNDKTQEDTEFPTRVKQEVADEIDLDEPFQVDDDDEKDAEAVEPQDTVESKNHVKNALENVKTKRTSVEIVDIGEMVDDSEVVENESVLDVVDSKVGIIGEEINEDAYNVEDVKEIVEKRINTTEAQDYTNGVNENENEEVMMPQIMNVYGNVNIEAEKLATLPLENKTTILKNNMDTSETNILDIEEVIRKKSVEFTTDIFKEHNPVTEDLEVRKTKNVEFTTDLFNDVANNDGVIKQTSENCSTHNFEEEMKDVSHAQDNVKSIETETLVKKDDDLPLQSFPEVINTGSAQTTVDAKTENIIDPYGEIPADMTFVDDGIEFVDDGIEFDEEDDDVSSTTTQTKSECGSTGKPNNTSEEIPKFDSKLLMHPLVYSLKLDHMTVFRNKDIDRVRDKTIIETALVESKPMYPIPISKKVVDDNIPHIQDIDHASDSEEDSVPEEMKVKISSYLLQKPRSRSYNPIQLCKNPDFNTRLKRLTIGFLSSTRNRLLLKKLKPMTIDLSKAFEEKLIDGTIYLKGGDRLTVKSEPMLKDESKPAIAMLPSTLLVQRLIDNTDESHVVQAPTSNTSNPHDSVLIERQKTINLPDIDHICRLNQQLLTVEVTPMRDNTDSDKYKPPVQLITSQDKESNLTINEVEDLKKNIKIETDPSSEEKNIAPNSLGVSDISYKDTQEKNKVIDKVEIQEKSSAITDIRTKSNQTVAEVTDTSSASATNVPSNKYKKNEKPSYWVPGYRVKPQARERLSWTKPQSNLNTVDDCLLTLDTLQKILNVIMTNGTDMLKMKSKQLKRAIKKRKGELEKKIEETLGTSGAIEGKQGVVSDPDISLVIDDKQKPSKKNQAKEKEEPAQKKTKVNIITTNNDLGAICCWARMKLISEDMANTKKHTCSKFCKCCCRNELAFKIKWSTKAINKPNEIIISDDEEARKINDSIENVVKQSTQTNRPRQRQKRKATEKSEMATQCDLEARSKKSDEALSASKTIIPSEKEIISPKKPLIKIVRKSRKIYPVPVNPVPSSGEVITLDDADDTSPGSTSMQIRQSPGLLAPERHVPKVLNNFVSIAPKVQGHIIIDGTNNMTVHSKPKPRTISFQVSGQKQRNKLIYINNSSQRSGGETAPIFLGKNKILLTDVKFPKEPSESPPVAIPNIQPVNTPLLPPGVQLILLPNGTLTYTLEPGTELSDEQKASLPAIIVAVQEQLNVSGTLPVNSPSVHMLTEDNSTVNMTTPTDVQTPLASTDVVNVPLHVNNAATETSEQDQTSASVENTDTDIVQTSPSESNNLEVTSNVLEPQNPLENETCTVYKETTVNESAKEAGNEEIGTKSNNENENNSNDGLVTQISPVLCNEQFAEDFVENIESEKVGESTVTKEMPQNTTILDNVQENLVEAQKESSDPSAVNSRKTLLSDLMEMSGIWEDIETTAPISNENTKGSDISTTEFSGAVPTEVAPEVLPLETLSNVAQPIVQPISSTVPTPHLIPLQPDNSEPELNSPVPELTPISTFAELKYACEHNGKFFKLDLEHGILSSGVKVCIKRQMPKSVIDLTEDDEEVQITQEVSKEASEESPKTYSLPNHLSRSLLKVQNPTMSTMDTVKPIKLFRSVRILQRNKEHAVLLPEDLNTDTTKVGAVGGKQNRKQNLEVRDDERVPDDIDDSSLDSASLDEYIYKESDFLDTSFDGDSSDEEPLAFKAKRMRQDGQPDVDTQKHNKTNVNLETGNLIETDKTLSQDEETDLGDNMVQELPNDLMAFMPDDTEGDDEDCILGF